MSEASHEIIHTDTLTKIVLAVLSASLVQGTEATAGGGASYPTPEKNPTPAYRPAGVAPSGAAALAVASGKPELAPGVAMGPAPSTRELMQRTLDTITAVLNDMEGLGSWTRIDDDLLPDLQARQRELVVALGVEPSDARHCGNCADGVPGGPDNCSKCGREQPHSHWTPRFPKTYCSQCGGEFGPGDQGFSHCDDHGEQHG
jgi:hypothetical protein